LAPPSVAESVDAVASKNTSRGDIPEDLVTTGASVNVPTVTGHAFDAGGKQIALPPMIIIRPPDSTHDAACAYATCGATIAVGMAHASASIAESIYARSLLMP
jgi:hypothetical protein